MIEEDFVSFKTAILLKEHGFNEKCNYVYDHDGTMVAAQNFMEGESSVDCDDIDSVAKYDGWITYTQGEYAYLCPTIARAMKWLREVHNIIINVWFSEDEYEGDCGWSSCCHPHISKNEPFIIVGDAYSSYELAAEEAIKYCLENYVYENPIENKNAKEKIISFDIKLRPEIEAGKYKVITRDGQDVIINSWDDGTNYPIIAKIGQVDNIYFAEDGRCSKLFTTSHDLFLKVVENEDNDN